MEFFIMSPLRGLMGLVIMHFYNHFTPSGFKKFLFGLFISSKPRRGGKIIGF